MRQGQLCVLGDGRHFDSSIHDHEPGILRFVTCVLGMSSETGQCTLVVGWVKRLLALAAGSDDEDCRLLRT